MEKALIVENVGKMYRLGTVGTGTLSHDLNRFWHKIRGKEDPYTKVGQENNRATASDNPYVWALKDINFSVDKGEVLGIIGKNGAGKSTLLKILSKITSPTTGCIKVNGRIASLLEVGTGFHPELTGRENIYLNGAILGMKRHEIKAKFDEIVEFSGCERYLDTPVKRYSSGMYVRLAFAVAAHLESEILIVDEVLAVGDAEFQKKCLGKMKDVSNKEGRTVLLVSHNLGVIRSISDKVLTIKNGMGSEIYEPGLAIQYYLRNDFVTNSENIDKLRYGAGGIIVESIDILDKNNERLNKIVAGEPVNIKLNYKVDSKNKYTNKIIPSIQFANTEDIPLILHHSRLEGIEYQINKEKGAFIFEINSFPFIEGEYLLKYSLVSNTEIIDAINGGIKIEVINGNYYSSGETPPSSHGFILIDGNWKEI